MRALLVRVGADLSKSGGFWNGPVDPNTGEFVYVPIPEDNPRAGFELPYQLLSPALEKINWCLKEELLQRDMHRDPDFEYLTYGDQGQRAHQIQKTLCFGDLLVFYAGLRSIRPPCDLIYAIIGLYVVETISLASCIPQNDWHKYAHTRRVCDLSKELVVAAVPSISGRLSQCLPIGSFRRPADQPHKRPSYRVLPELLTAWGGLSVSDGFIQRSVFLPAFNDASRFYTWFKGQGVSFIQRNN